MDAFRNFSEYTSLNSIALTRGTVARIKDGRGMQLQVEHGAVWITQSGDREDVFLDAGQSFRITRNGMTLLSTCNGARFALVTLEPPIEVKPPLGEQLAVGFWKLWTSLYAADSRPTTASL